MMLPGKERSQRSLEVNDSDFNSKAMKVFLSGEVLWSGREPQCSANSADLNSGIQTCASCYSKLPFATVKCFPKEKEKSMISGTKPHPGGIAGGRTAVTAAVRAGDQCRRNAFAWPICYWLLLAFYTHAFLKFWDLMQTRRLTFP